MNSPRTVVSIDRKGLTLIIAILVVATLGPLLWSEVLTLVTAYPVPSGIYNQIITTGNSGSSPADTILNRNAGDTILVPATNTMGNVGIGTMSPAAKLDVVGDFGAASIRFTGGMQIGYDPAACNGAKAGTLRWHAGKWEVCDGSTWK